MRHLCSRKKPDPVRLQRVHAEIKKIPAPSWESVSELEGEERLDELGLGQRTHGKTLELEILREQFRLETPKLAADQRVAPFDQVLRLKNISEEFLPAGGILGRTTTAVAAAAG